MTLLPLNGRTAESGWNTRAGMCLAWDSLNLPNTIFPGLMDISWSFFRIYPIQSQ